jgi:hypothetical protein
MAFLAGGEQFLVWNGWPGDKEQALRAFEVESGRELWRTTNTGVNLPGDVLLAPNQLTFGIVSGESGRLRLFRLPTFEEVGTTSEGCQAIGTSGEQFLMKDQMDQWLSWDIPGESRIPLRTDWTRLGFVSAFSPDGKHLASGTEEGIVLVADIPAVRRRLATLRR